MEQPNVGVFWDHGDHGCHIPENFTTAEAVSRIRGFGLGYGTVTVFKVYIGDSQAKHRDCGLVEERPSFLAELQASGVWAHSDSNAFGLAAMLADIFSFSMDNGTRSTSIVISGNPFFSYGLSLLSFRRHHVVVVRPWTPTGTDLLSCQVADEFGWDLDVLLRVQDGANCSSGRNLSPSRIEAQSVQPAEKHDGPNTDLKRPFPLTTPSIGVQWCFPRPQSSGSYPNTPLLRVEPEQQSFTGNHDPSTLSVISLSVDTETTAMHVISRNHDDFYHQPMSSISSSSGTRSAFSSAESTISMTTPSSPRMESSFFDFELASTLDDSMTTSTSYGSLCHSEVGESFEPQAVDVEVIDVSTGSVPSFNLGPDNSDISLSSLPTCVPEVTLTLLAAPPPCEFYPIIRIMGGFQGGEKKVDYKVIETHIANSGYIPEMYSAVGLDDISGLGSLMEDYLALAERANIVQLGTDDNASWARLNPEFYPLLVVIAAHVSKGVKKVPHDDLRYLLQSCPQFLAFAATKATDAEHGAENVTFLEYIQMAEEAALVQMTETTVCLLGT